MVSKYLYLLLNFDSSPYGCAIGYICDKFGDFQMPFRSTSNCFCYNLFRIELRYKCVNISMECWYIPVLLWKRVLVGWSCILKAAIATPSNVIPFDSEYNTSY